MLHQVGALLQRRATVQIEEGESQVLQYFLGQSQETGELTEDEDMTIRREDVLEQIFEFRELAGALNPFRALQLEGTAGEPEPGKALEERNLHLIFSSSGNLLLNFIPHPLILGHLHVRKRKYIVNLRFLRQFL